LARWQVSVQVSGRLGPSQAADRLVQAKLRRKIAFFLEIAGLAKRAFISNKVIFGLKGWNREEMA